MSSATAGQQQINDTRKKARELPGDDLPARHYGAQAPRQGVGDAGGSHHAEQKDVAQADAVQASVLAHDECDHDRSADYARDPEACARSLMPKQRGSSRHGQRDNAKHHARMRRRHVAQSDGETHRVGDQHAKSGEHERAPQGARREMAPQDQKHEHGDDPGKAGAAGGEKQRIEPLHADPRHRNRRGKPTHGSDAKRQAKIFAGGTHADDDASPHAPLKRERAPRGALFCITAAVRRHRHRWCLALARAAA